MSKIYLYLDDVRVPTNPIWTVVRNYKEFVDKVTLVGLDGIELISLDHDLGDTAMSEYYANVRPNYTLDYRNIVEKTGMDCVKWLVQFSMDTGIRLPQVKVHSANPIGAANMMGYINNYYKNCDQPQVCSRIRIEHTYLEPLTEEERKEKYKKVPPCVGHDTASQEEEELNRRMDIIGQNGNTGEHYGLDN